MKINYQFFFSAIVISLVVNLQPLKGQGSTSINSGRNKGTKGSKINWTANPFDHKVFIENKGQFEGPQNGDKILYGAQVGDVFVFITPHGLVYKYTERPEVHPSPDKKGYEMVDPDE